MSKKPKVTIIGAGIAGISTAVALKNELGYEDFVIYEKSSEIGGTWRDNTYPGCGSDIPCHWYSLSTELNSDWSSYYASQPEIRHYWESIFKKYELESHLVRCTNVSHARWDNGAQAYELTVEDMRTGKTKSVMSELLVSAAGGFTAPAYPKDLSGSEVFRGDMWHSARWKHDVPLGGKKVGVIGNGCSSAQIVPAVAKDPTVQLVNFCRTPQWYVAKPQYNYPSLVKWIFRNVPFVLRWYRNWIMARCDIVYLAFIKRNKAILAAFRKGMEEYMKKTAPEEYHDVLIPKYTPGCRRIIVDPGYLECLGQPNVTLCWHAMDRIIETGILLKNGQVIELDVIILGTGFDLMDPGPGMKGSDGRTLQGYFDSKQGPTAYLGTCVPGFPNFFMLMGPNITTGHASVVFAEEVQIQYSLKLMRPVIDGLAKSFEIRDEATDSYNEYIQERHSGFVTTMDCASYYLSKSGRNFVTFPGSMTLFYWLTRKVCWEGFKVVEGDQWSARRKSSEMRNTGLLLLLMVVFVAALTTGLGTTMAVRVNVNLE